MSVILTSISLFISLNFLALPSNVSNEKGFTLEELPEYVVIRCGAYGGGSTLELGIDHRKGRYDTALEALEEYLSNRKKRAVRSQSELLTEMSEIGFDYVNAYQIGTVGMINVVFRKKEEFR